MRFYLLFLIIFQISCSQKSENSPEKDKYSHINSKREEFVNLSFNAFKSDVDQSSFYLNQYEKLKLQAMSLNGKDVQPLNQLDQAFKLKHGEGLNEIQNLLKNYEVDSENLQQILKTLKNDLEILSKQYEENLSLFNLCKDEANNQKADAEKQRDKANRSLKKLEADFDSNVSSAKSYRDSAAKWKKKVAHSNWPPDKKRYANKAADQANKAKSYAIKANKIYDSITESVNKTKEELSIKVKKLDQKFSQCKLMNTNLSREANDLEELASQYRQTGEQLVDINNKVKQLYTDNEVLLKDFDQYKLQRDVIIGSLKERLAERKDRFEQSHQNNIKNYGPEYLSIYKKVADWLSKSYVDGKETADLLEYLRRFDSLKIKVFYKSIYEILELSTNKKTVSYSNFIDRKIASFIYIEIGDIKIPQLPNIKIDLPDLPEIRIDLPSITFKLPEVKLDLPQINLSLPQLTLNNTLPDITFDLPELMYFKLENFSITTDIPELKIAKINWDISGDIGHIFQEIKSIRITLPSIELVRIKADVWGDIQNPERIFQNTGRETIKSAGNVYREIGNGVKEMRKIYLQSKGVDFDKLMTQLRKGVGVCRYQKGLVKKQVDEIKTVVDLLEAKRLGLISDDEYSRRYEKMLKETQILQGYGLTAAGVGSLASSAYLSHLVFSIGATTISSSTILVGQIGLIGIGVAATLNYMASSAQRELEIEHDKIKECSKDLNKLLIDLEEIHKAFIQDELEGKSLLAQVRQRIEDHQKELFEIDFASETYLENLDQIEHKVHKDMLKFKQSAILIGDKQTLKLITDFLNTLGVES